jgi:hypothetical protein
MIIHQMKAFQASAKCDGRALHAGESGNQLSSDEGQQPTAFKRSASRVMLWIAELAGEPHVEPHIVAAVVLGEATHEVE